MSTKPLRVPSYRLHRTSGQAVVTLADCRTKRRRSVYLGVHGTPASRKRYAEVIAAWEDAGRVLDGELAGTTRQTVSRKIVCPADETVTRLIVDYLQAAVLPHYEPRAAEAFKLALKVLRSECGGMPAAEFGPKSFKRVRQAFVDQGLAHATVRARLQIVKRLIAWGVEEERLPGDRLQALKAVQHLRKDAPGLNPAKRVLPVPEADIAAVEPHVAPQVWALIRLQLLSGARPGELVGLRPVDLDTSGHVWAAELHQHKAARHGRERVLVFGPRAQGVLEPYLAGRPVDRPFFSPAEAYAAMRAARADGAGRRDGQTHTPRASKRRIGDRYSVDSYRRHITKACERAGVDPWTPHRLRHNAATAVRREFGIEESQLVLGHASATLTDAVYAERDHQKVRDIIAKIG